jgi:hypothetical protein
MPVRAPSTPSLETREKSRNLSAGKSMEKPTRERRNVARHRALKRAQIVFKGHEAVIDCVVVNLSDGAHASKWKAPSEFPIHSILCLTMHSSAIAA